MRNHLHTPFRSLAMLLRHERGSALVETAIALPLLITLLFGILVYGSWFMTAHCLQQAANDAARSAVAGLDGTERRLLVDQSVTASRSTFPAPAAQTIAVATDENGGYYKVTLRYNLANAPIYSASPFPIANTTLERSAVVRVSAL